MTDPYRDPAPKPAKRKARKCPACGLVNPAAATRCDCGRSFVDGSMGPALELPDQGERLSGTKKVFVVLALVGVVFLMFGVFAVSAPWRGGIREVGDVFLVIGGVLLSLAVRVGRAPRR